MDYKEQIEQAKNAAVRWQEKHPVICVGELRVDRIIEDLTESITDLLARAEAAEAQLRKVRQILSDPLIVCGENNTLRPVKRTSKQDVYTTVLKAQKVVGVVGRWFPKEWEET